MKIVVKILISVSAGLIIGLLTFITILLIDVRDNDKYIQPAINQELIKNDQQLKIEVNKVDSMACLRNENVNKRVDLNYDLANQLSIKIDSILKIAKYQTYVLDIITKDPALRDFIQQFLTSN